MISLKKCATTWDELLDLDFDFEMRLFSNMCSNGRYRFVPNSLRLSDFLVKDYIKWRVFLDIVYHESNPPSYNVYICSAGEFYQSEMFLGDNVCDIRESIREIMNPLLHLV